MEHHFEEIQDPPIDVMCLLYNHKIPQLKCKVRNIPNHSNCCAIRRTQARI